VARTLASTTITICAQRRYRRLQRDRTSRAAARPVKDLLKGRLAGLLDEPGPQVFLEGLVRGSCTLTQDGMSLLGHIFDLYAGHGAIMALEAPFRKRVVIGMCGRSAAARADGSVPDRHVLHHLMDAECLGVGLNGGHICACDVGVFVRMVTGSVSV
jgi:hypothetical protein